MQRLWSDERYLEECAPTLDRDSRRVLARPADSPWTTSDLPLLDAARLRAGDPEASRARRQRESALAQERERMSRVIDDLVASHDLDDGEGLMTMLTGQDLQNALVDESAIPTIDPDQLAGPFAHIIVDEAQELTDAEWGMLVRRCPSKSFTIVGDRAQSRHGFSESWQERLERVGIRDSTVRPLGINYRTPQEIMTAAEPVIRAVLPGANVPTSIRRSGIPVAYGSMRDVESVVDEWLAAHNDGIVCLIGRASRNLTRSRNDRVRTLTPELSKGLEFDFVVLLDPDSFGEGIAGAVDRYVAMTRATQRLVVLS